jgi:hypothetical protein
LNRANTLSRRIRIVISIIVAGVLAFRLIQIEILRSTHLGKLSANEALANGERLCTFGAPPGFTYRMSASFNLVRDGQGRERRFWVVECTDKAGIDLSHAIIDGDTGSSLHVAFTRWYSDSTGAPISDRRTAFGKAYTALECSRIASRPQDWRLERTTRFTDRTWAVWLHSSEYSANVRMEARTGKLLQISISPLKRAESRMARG